MTRSTNQTEQFWNVTVVGNNFSAKTFDQFDRIVRRAYKDEGVTVSVDRFMAVLNFKQFFHNTIDFKNYGSARTNSARAQAEGGRDPNILYYRLWLEDRVPVLRYKYFECDSDLLFLPDPVTKPPIKVPSMIDCNTSPKNT